MSDHFQEHSVISNQEGSNDILPFQKEKKNIEKMGFPTIATSEELAVHIQSQRWL